MATDLVYKVGKVGSGKYEKRKTAATGISLFNDKINKLTAPLQLRPNGRDWSAGRSTKDTKLRADEIVRDGDAGVTLSVRSENKENEPHFIIKVDMVDDTTGNTVVQAAKSQLGVDYVWADIDPIGGGSSGFDCSGLVVWCYAQADVRLPHMAEAIRQDNEVTHFSERSKIKPGDMIFYHYTDRVGPGAADHIAIAISKDTQIAASSSHDAVVRQSIDFNNVMHYGFVRSVTGAH